MSAASGAYRFLAVSMIVRVPADYDRDAIEDGIVQVVGCSGVNDNAGEPEGCPLVSFGSCGVDDVEDAYRWVHGPSWDEDEPAASEAAP